MTWTDERKQQLSREVAEKYGIPSKIMVAHVNGCPALCDKFMLGDEVEVKPLWLHEYSHAVIWELCVKHGVSAVHTDEYFPGIIDHVESYICDEVTEGCFYADHNNDPSEAERIARLLALREV